MYGQIFAVSEVNEESSGKTMRVWSDADSLSFSIDPEKKILVIKASCSHEMGTGERGGEVSAINRKLLLELEKDEVEKLVASALNNKLLKKLEIGNLQSIDLVGKLQLDIDRYKAELDSARREIKRLHKVISKAKAALNEF